LTCGTTVGRSSGRETHPTISGQRGHAVWLDFFPKAGKEQEGRRPALVVSGDDYNKKVSFAVVCPIINKGKGYPFEVAIPDGYKVTGVVLSDHVKSMDWQKRKAVFICTLPETVVEKVLAKIAALVELDLGGDGEGG
jgi:mRNA interferase MazF